MLVIPIQQLLSSYLWHSSSSFTCILLFRRDLALLFRIQLGPVQEGYDFSQAPFKLQHDFLDSVISLRK